MSVSILDPEKMYLSILGVKIEGFSEGTFVAVDRKEEAFSSRNSLKGTSHANKRKYSGYDLKFRLDNTVPANTWLHSLFKLQEQYGIVIPIPLVFKDMNGQTSFFCPACLLQEPNLTKGNKVETLEWNVICPKAIYAIGGNGDVGAITQVVRALNTVIALSGMLGIDLSSLQNQAQEAISKGIDLTGGFFR